MAQTKVEIIFIEPADNERGYNLLSTFSADAHGGAMASIPLPNVGDRVNLKLGAQSANDVVRGLVESKIYSFATEDMLGESWDLVINVIFTIKRADIEASDTSVRFEDAQ